MQVCIGNSSQIWSPEQNFSRGVRWKKDATCVHAIPCDAKLVIRSPHLGTDNLVRLLRNMRADLRSMGGEIHFGARCV